MLYGGNKTNYSEFIENLEDSSALVVAIDSWTYDIDNINVAIKLLVYKKLTQSIYVRRNIYFPTCFPLLTEDVLRFFFTIPGGREDFLLRVTIVWEVSDDGTTDEESIDGEVTDEGVWVGEAKEISLNILILYFFHGLYNSFHSIKDFSESVIP